MSGTIGAALEGAALGIPSLAVALETEMKQHYSLSKDVDFSTAAYFCAYFGRKLLSNQFPEDVDVLKVDIPCDATTETPWQVTRVSRRRYFEPLTPERATWDTPTRIGYRHHLDRVYESDAPDSDAYVMRVRRMVSVTPLSLDLTSRIELRDLEQILREE